MNNLDSSPLGNSSGRRMRVFEAACLVTAAGLAVVHTVRFVQAPDLPAWAALLAVTLGLPAADFLSGFVHWAGDTWGRVTTRWIGPRLLVPFRYHHLHPRDMLRSPFVTTNGDAAMVACFILGTALLIPLDSLGASRCSPPRRARGGARPTRSTSGPTTRARRAWFGGSSERG